MPRERRGARRYRVCAAPVLVFSVGALARSGAARERAQAPLCTAAGRRRVRDGALVSTQ